jgi:virginiamycin B lyase
VDGRNCGGMQRRTLALLLLLTSTGVACGRGGYESESGGVSPSMFSATTGSLITGPPMTGPPMTGPATPPYVPGPTRPPLSPYVVGPGGAPEPPAPAGPTGGFGPVIVEAQRQRAPRSNPAGADGGAENCWAEPVLTEYTLTAAGGKPSRVAAAADGSVWFSDPATTSVGRLEASGALTRYRFPDGRTPGSLAVARDGSVWVTTAGPAIAHLTRDGHLVGHAIPRFEPHRIGGTGNASPAALTAGPDGAIWFLDMDADIVGRVTGDGKITQYPLPDRARMHINPEDMVVGPDGALWFSETLKMRIGRIDPKTSAITEFPIPDGPNGIGAASLTVGSDGALWFDGGGPALGRMTTKGQVRIEPLPWQGQYRPNSITAGPDGRLWFIDGRWGKVVRMSLQGDVAEMTQVADPSGLYAASLEQMDAGPDAIWFAQPALNRIGRFACPDPDSPADAV